MPCQTPRLVGVPSWVYDNNNPVLLVMDAAAADMADWFWEFPV